MARKLSHRRGFTGPEIAFMAGIIAILIGLLMPSAGHWEGVVRQMEKSSSNGLRNIALASINYADDRRLIAHKLHTLFADAVTSGQVDAEQLKDINILMMTSEDNLDDALVMYSKLPSQEKLSDKDLQLLNRAIEVLKEMQADMSAARKLIGLLLPKPDGT